MRWKIPASVLLALALLIPASSAVAQPRSSKMIQTTCEMVVYKDLRTLVKIDLDTASDLDVRLLANQLLSAAKADSLTVLPGRIQDRLLNGTADDLRAFLKTDWEPAWRTDLRVKTTQTLVGAGPNVQAATTAALDNGTTDVLLAYLNNGLYVARALDAGWTLKVYRDLRTLVKIDLDTASDLDVRLLANQLMSAARADTLTVLPARIQERLDGTADDLRAFLKTNWQSAWSVDLRVKTTQTLTGAGPNVQAATTAALDNGTTDVLLAYLNNGLYVARALDACGFQRVPRPAMR